MRALMLHYSPLSFMQVFGCVLCAVGSYALNNKVAALTGQTLPQGTNGAGEANQSLLWEATLDVAQAHIRWYDRK
jgi:hypothetical protein